MKNTKLKQLIKEEIQTILKESSSPKSQLRSITIPEGTSLLDVVTQYEDII